MKIAANATLIQPHQILLDQIYGKGIGTTGNGIGPAYADRALRTTHILKNLRVCDFFVNPLKATKIVEANVNETIKAHKLKNINAKKIASDFKKQAMKLKEYYCPDPLYLEKQVRKGKKVFFEGAQSVMLDVSTGSVPFVTSSRTIAAAAYTGGDTSNRTHKNTIGVGKAIMSRVGNGPFISEFGRSKSEKYCAEEGGYKNIREVESKKYNMKTLLKSPDPFKIGIALRLLGFEYGATTKRPRRIGMLDLVMLKQNCMLNGVDELYLNKFDCLTDYNKTSLPGIPVVTAYKLKGKKIDYIPTTPKEAEAAIPVVKYLPHIKKDISKIRDFNLLPTAAKKLVKFIEKQVGTPLYGIGVGPERDQFIQIKK